jgi:hypothetical protein
MQINTQDADLPRLSSINHQVQSSKRYCNSPATVPKSLWNFLGADRVLLKIFDRLGNPKDRRKWAKKALSEVKNYKTKNYEAYAKHQLKAAGFEIDHD